MVVRRRGPGDGEDGSGADQLKDRFANAMGVQTTSHMTLVKSARVSKQDREVLGGTQLAKDDLWEPYFFDPSHPQAGAQVLRPPYEPKSLSLLVQNNNALGQLISAMEVNIDGSGWDIDMTPTAAKEKEMADKAAKLAKEKARDEAKAAFEEENAEANAAAMADALERGLPPPKPAQFEEEDEEEIEEEVDPKKKELMEFFDEPFPRVSFTTMRRNLRRDMERVGYGFLEVLRAVDGTLTFLKRIPVDQMRLLKLDDPVVVEQTVMRGGEELQVRMPVRERRFAQIQGKKIVYFREYGTSREVDRKTGEWAGTAESLPAEERGTEVLFFKVYEDATTPYGVPRWITQVPSVLGSRKAEELNLDFFNSGGLPPALILIQGGQLTEEVRKQLNSYLSGKGSSVHRAAVVEVHSSGGSIDSAGSVRVTVERFGSERMQDSMFENYDERCEERTRASFRLPPIFVGKSQDYTYATAFASYTVAEAQVFMPERMEFDEIINNTVMRELDPDGTWMFSSQALTVNDVATKLEALGTAQSVVEREGWVDEINEAAGLDLVAKEGDVHFSETGEPFQLGPNLENAPAGAAPTGLDAPKPPSGSEPASNQGGQSQPRAAPTAKMETFDMMTLVQRWCDMHTTTDVTADEAAFIRRTVDRMGPEERERFDSYCTLRLMSGAEHDFAGAVELFSAATDIPSHPDHADDSRY